MSGLQRLGVWLCFSICLQVFGGGEPVPLLIGARAQIDVDLYRDLFRYYNGELETPSAFGRDRERLKVIEELARRIKPSTAQYSNLISYVILADKSPMIRGWAARWIATLGDSSETFVDNLIATTLQDTHCSVQKAAYGTLRKISPTLSNPKKEIASLVVETLADAARDNFADPTGFALALHRLAAESSDALTQLSALEGLCDLDERALSQKEILQLVEIARTLDVKVRDRAILTLAHVHADLPKLNHLFEDLIVFPEVNPVVQATLGIYLLGRQRGMVESLITVIPALAYGSFPMDAETLKIISDGVRRLVRAYPDEVRGTFHYLAGDPTIFAYPLFLELYSEIFTGRSTSFCQASATAPGNRGHLKIVSQYSEVE